MAHGDAATPDDVRTVQVAIVGSGFSGLGMAIELVRHGRGGPDDLLVLEAADAVGGTWRDNTYPGAACDVPSHLYSFSFAPKPDWSRRYASQEEIRTYLEHCVDRYALHDRIELGAAVSHARWDAESATWLLQIADGRVIRARYAVFAVGALTTPRWPDIDGLDDFTGPVLHSARWDPSVDLAGKRVGIIGTGASAIQIGPAIADEVEHLTVFQRTPPWIRPRNDRAFTDVEKRRFAKVPGRMLLERLRTYAWMETTYVLFFGPLYRRTGPLLQRWAEGQLSEALDDPELTRAATPDYRIGCKRVLSSDDWYPTLKRDDVTLQPRAIERITESGVQIDGQDVPLDVLICCTGFEVDAPLGELDIEGVDGRSLQRFWGDRPRALLGTTIPGFPNAFSLFGPNTGLGHTSMIVMIEAQIRYVLRAMEHLEQTGRTWLDVRQDALDAFVAEMDARHRDRVWLSGCNSWYLGEDGTNFTLWPGSTLRFLARTRQFDPEPYDFG